MSIAVVVPVGLELNRLLPWCARLAQHRKQALHVVMYQESISLPSSTSSETVDFAAVSQQRLQTILTEAEIPFVWQDEKQTANEPPPTDVNLENAEVSSEGLLLSLKTVRDAEPVELLLEELATLKPSLVILPRHHSVKLRSSEYAIERTLFQRTSCAVMQLRMPLPEEPCEFKKLLVTTGCELSSRFALSLAVSLAESADGTVDALHIQPDIGSLSEQVGQERISKILSSCVDGNDERIRKRILVTKNLNAGFASIQNMDLDLIIVGAEYHSVIERKLFSSVAEQLLSSTAGPPVAVIRPAIPVQHRLRHSVERLLRSSVPQLNRQERVELVDRIQQSSEWDIDFIALIVLSTLIAALGLVQNSAAVVIGAMLVAPLMTPLLGSGLSLVQGNRLLALKASRTVLLGFITAYFLGVILGFVVPGAELTSEMHKRGSPGLPDIVIAFLSGMAAVYAMGRPHLTSALPGVAIAASLVPPIATSGLATSLGSPALAFGSALLFLTNIVAIILGSGVCWWMIGFRDSHEHGGFGTWAPRTAFALLILAIGLGVYESWPHPTPRDNVEQEVANLLEEYSDVSLMEVIDKDEHGHHTVRVVLGSENPPLKTLHQQIQEEIAKFFPPETDVQIEWRKLWIAQPLFAPKC